MSEGNGRHDDDGRAKVSLKEKLNQIRIRESSQGNYFTMRRSLVQSECMTRNEALFYTDLCNLACMASDKWTREIDGKLFFLCTVGYVEEFGLSWDRNIQQRMLAALQEKGFVEVVYKGHPPTRYVWINADAVEEAINKWRSSKSIKQCSSKSIKQCYNKEYTPNGVYSEQSKNLSRPAVRACDGGSDGLDLPEPVPSQDSVLSRERAIRLRDALSRHSKLMRTPNIDRWAQQFRHLTTQRTPQQIDSALDWYCDHVGGRYVPQAFSAKAFVDSFPKIESAMSRSSNGHTEKPMMELSADEQAAYKTLREELSWPADGLEHLPRLVHESFGGHRRFVAALKRAMGDGGLSKTVRGLAAYLLEQEYGGKTSEFVVRWVAGCHERYQNWDEWNGVIKPFGVGNPKVTNACRKLASEYTISDSAWTDLRQYMEKHQ